MAIISKPISESEKLDTFGKLLSIRDDVHAIAKRTIGKDVGESNSVTKGIQFTTGEQTTTGFSSTEGSNFGYSTPGLLGFIFGTVNTSSNTSRTINKSKSENKSKSLNYSKTNEEHESRSLTFEQQNGFAIELEKIADQYIERMKKGLNSGLWETTISFSAKDEITCEIIGGCLVGELSKPNDRILPPPRLYIDTLETNQLLFLPKATSSNPIFPKNLASYISSEELALISSPLKESVAGYEIKKMPSLAQTDSNEGEYILGNITDHSNIIENSYITISRSDLNKHLFVCGLTGSGKTTTVKNILKKLQNSNIPFLVLESAKRDYRQILADDSFKGKINIFTVGDATVSPICFNPFYIQKGIHPIVHIDYLKAIFNASFSLYGPMPHIIEKCLHNIYLKKGWNMTTGIHPIFLNKQGDYDENIYNLNDHYYCYPTLFDLRNEIDEYVKNELEYKGELRDNIRTAIIARLDSLSVGAKGLMFNTYDFYSIENLLNQSTILEMESLADDDDKAFFVGLILTLISEYRQKNNPAINPGSSDKGLQHFMVIEEAHRLLKNVTTERTSEMMGNPKGKAVETFCNVISEMRSFGQGVAVVEQIPTKISPDIIKNSNTKIVHRLVSKDDQSLLAGSLSITDEDSLYLNRLTTGHALCHKEGMERPVECIITDNIKSYAISDDNINKMMKEKNVKNTHNKETYELSTVLNKKSKEVANKLLNTLFVVEYPQVKNLLQLAIKEIKKLIITNNIRSSFNDKIILDLFLKHIIEFLHLGVYCKSYNFPDSFICLIEDFLENPIENKYMKVKKSFAIIWDTSEPKIFINEVVKNISLKYLFDNKLKLTNDNIKFVVESFFILKNPIFITEIIENIEKSLEVKNA